MEKDQHTQAIHVAICPKCQTLYGAMGHCTVPTCKSARLLQVQSNSSRIGDSIDDKFTLLAQIGKGGMGTVYRALQHSMEREVALKLLNPSISEDLDSVKRFLREAKQASILNHPHIITLFDFGQTESGDLYLVMELLEGDTLSRLLKTEGHLPPERAVNIIAQICEALQYAHSEGIIHRDLKPDNLFMVRKAGQTRDFAKILDFGLAKVNTLSPQHSITTTGIVCGTPAYMSPEQALSKDVDRRSDLYSLGVILYEMLSGARPFGGDSPVQMLMAHVNARPPTIRESDPNIKVPVDLEAVLMAALSKKPSDRPPDAQSLSQCLWNALDKEGSEVATTSLQSIDSRMGVTQKDGEGVEDMVSAETMVGSLESMGLTVATKPRYLLRFAGIAAIAAIVFFLVRYPLDDSSDGTAPGTENDKEEITSSSGDDDRDLAAAETPVPDNLNATNVVPVLRKNGPLPQSLDANTLGNPTPVVPAPQPAPRRMELTSIPVGALVTIDGAYIGKTPFPMDKPPAGKPFQVTLSMEGYESQTLTLSDRALDKVEFSLKKIEKKKKPRKPSKPRKPKPGGGIFE